MWTHPLQVWRAAAVSSPPASKMPRWAFHELDPSEQEEAKAQCRKLHKFLSVGTFYKVNGQPVAHEGCMRTHSGGKKLELFPHQGHAALRLNESIREDKERAERNGDSPNMSNTVMMAIWDPGSGKTILTITAIAHRWKKTLNKNDFCCLLIVPLSIVKMWEEECLKWLDPEKMKRRPSVKASEVILAAEKHQQMTEKALKNASVVITSVHALSAALRKSHWKNPRAFEIFLRSGGTAWKAGYVRGRANSDELPPLHPFFKMLEGHEQNSTQMLEMVVIDECHLHSRPETTWNGFTAKKIALRSGIKLGLTGTPVKGSPDDMAGLCSVMDVPKKWMQEVRNWRAPNDKKGFTVRTHAVQKLHSLHMDRATMENLTPAKLHNTVLSFWPYVGRMSDGSYSMTVHQMHQSAVMDAATVIAQMASRFGQNANRASMMGRLLASLTFCEKAVFNSVLALNGADAFKPNSDPESHRLSESLYEQAIANPSEQMKVLARVVRDRQQKGMERVVMHCASVTMIEICCRYFKKLGGFGKHFMLTGDVSGSTRRNLLVDSFKARKGRGIFWMTDCGSMGLTLCGGQGCACAILFGSLPWLPMVARQVAARLYRCTQDRDTEVITVCAYGSVAEKKVKNLWVDKTVLERVMVDQEFHLLKKSNTDGENEKSLWRQYESIAKSLTHLRPCDGNYGLSRENMRCLEMWVHSCERAAKFGRPQPPQPECTKQPAAKLAYDIDLPPCPFPTPGFVEKEMEEGEDGEIDRGKYLLKRPAPAPAAAASKKKTKRKKQEDPVTDSSDDECFVARKKPQKTVQDYFKGHQPLYVHGLPSEGEEEQDAGTSGSHARSAPEPPPAAPGASRCPPGTTEDPSAASDSGSESDEEVNPGNKEVAEEDEDPVEECSDEEGAQAAPATEAMKDDEEDVDEMQQEEAQDQEEEEEAEGDAKRDDEADDAEDGRQKDRNCILGDNGLPEL